MKTNDILRRAALNLRQAKMRTILTSLAVAVGAFTVMLALAAGAGGRDYADTLISGSGDEANLSVFPQYEEVEQNGPPKYGVSENEQTRLNDLSNEDVAKLEAIKGVERVEPMYSVDALYVTREGKDEYMVSLQVKADRTELRLAAGSLDNHMLKPGTVAIPETYLAALGFSSAKEAIGKQVHLRIQSSANESSHRDYTYSIEAVTTKTEAMLYYSEAVFLSVDDASKMYDFQTSEQNDSYSGINVQVSDGANISSIQDSIAGMGYIVTSLQDQRASLFSAVNTLQWGMAGFGFIAILASIFGIVNTQYISVLERTQQIGLMKALGARRKDIAKLFRFEAAWVGFLGGLIGTALAVMIGLLINPFIANLLEVERGTALLKFEPLTIIVIIVSLMAIAVAAGYLPARKAAKLDPIDALRTE